MLDDIQGITFDLWQTLIIDNRELGRSRAQRRIEETINSLLMLLDTTFLTNMFRRRTGHVTEYVERLTKQRRITVLIIRLQYLLIVSVKISSMSYIKLR